MRFTSSQLNPSKGFTLIELLVVIAIIGVLASTVFASLNTARLKARNARRKADLSQLRLALELYYDSNGGYPSTASAWFESEPGGNGNYNAGNYMPGVAPTYIAVLPRDPRGGASLIQPTCGTWLSSYLYLSDGVNYTLLSHCAPEGTLSASDSFYDPMRPTWAWKICSGQSVCI